MACKMLGFMLAAGWQKQDELLTALQKITCKIRFYIMVSERSASVAVAHTDRPGPQGKRIPLTWRVRNSPACCLAFLSAAKAPGVATIWPSSKADCLLFCCMGNSFRWFVFASQRRRTQRRIKSKCSSWRGEAPGHPRCQGRAVFAFIGAERRPLIRRSGQSRRRFSARKGCSED
jgi:hypothetical protein